ncbi:MAG: hypothetical protein ABSC37_09590, partial [Xanthobacteraceae bacterium]
MRIAAKSPPIRRIKQRLPALRGAVKSVRRLFHPASLFWTFASAVFDYLRHRTLIRDARTRAAVIDCPPRTSRNFRIQQLDRLLEREPDAIEAR